MALAIPFPEIDPVIFHLGPLPIRWYAVSYMVGLALGWLLVMRLMRMDRLWPGAAAPLEPMRTDDLLLWSALGVVLGGRLGFVLFYNPSLLWPEPWRALEIWDGGMAFHGGMLGVIIAVILYTRARRLSTLSVGDAVACATPIGLFFGRIANFINGELWGRPTEASWGMIFPGVTDYARALRDEGLLTQTNFDLLFPGNENVARHPSQLYEAALEGLLLFAILAFLAFRTGALKRPGLCVGVFLIGYGVARFLVEFVRQWDLRDGFDFFIFGEGITRGQTLCIPMIIAGVLFVLHARRVARRAQAAPP